MSVEQLLLARRSPTAIGEQIANQRKIRLANWANLRILSKYKLGGWLSWLERLVDVEKVTGSSPVPPIHQHYKPAIELVLCCMRTLSIQYKTPGRADRAFRCLFMLRGVPVD